MTQHGCWAASCRAYTRLQLGEITAARALCEQSDGMSNPAHRAVYAAVTAEDPHVVMIGRPRLGVYVSGLRRSRTSKDQRGVGGGPPA